MTMGYQSSDHDRPLFYTGGYPVFLTTLLVGLHVAAAFACCVLMAVHANALIEALILNTAHLLHGWLWQVVTYAFVHAPQPDSIGPSLIYFFIGMYLLWMFGHEVERFIGRKAFALMYLALLLTTPILAMLVRLLSRTDLEFTGSAVIHFSIFIAFAAIYPNVQFFLINIPAKWLAVIALAAYTMGCIAYNWWFALLDIWASAGVAFASTRFAGVGEGFEFLAKFTKPSPQKAAARAAIRPRAKPRRSAEAPKPGDVHESIDPLLEKISKHGLASLSQSERATLERARVSLLRKERAP